MCHKRFSQVYILILPCVSLMHPLTSNFFALFFGTFYPMRYNEIYWEFHVRASYYVNWLVFRLLNNQANC